MLPVVYQDDYLIAVNKPSGLLVHRSAIDKYETTFAVQTLRNQLGKKVYPIHRLDKPTSGILLFATSSDITQQVASQWQQVEKDYLCVVRGNIHDTALEHPIRTRLDNGEEKIQTASTIFTRVGGTTIPVSFGKSAAHYRATHFSLVKAMPKTGRKHQIRKHCKHLNHPIVGDTRYGRGEINRYFRQHYYMKRLLLHCQAMRLIHPVSDKPLCLYAKLDSTWCRLLTNLTWSFEC